MDRPIGIFDSGIGGLTVVKEVIRQLPGEDIVYFGDTARVPYGAKSPQTVIKYSIENTLFLLNFRVKLIIVACNTSSSYSLRILRDNFKIPLIGVITPGAQEALRATKSGRIGVIGTSATVESGAYEKEIRNIDPRAKVFSRACPLFVSLAEEGWLTDKVTYMTADRYLRPLKARRIDTLILGCTHYPLLKQVIGKVMGKSVKIIDSASSVAEEVHAILMSMGELSGSKKKPHHRFFATDAVEHFIRVGEKFLGTKIYRAERANYV